MANAVYLDGFQLGLEVVQLVLLTGHGPKKGHSKFFALQLGTLLLWDYGVREASKLPD